MLSKTRRIVHNKQLFSKNEYRRYKNSLGRDENDNIRPYFIAKMVLGIFVSCLVINNVMRSVFLGMPFSGPKKDPIRIVSCSHPNVKIATEKHEKKANS